MIWKVWPAALLCVAIAVALSSNALAADQKDSTSSIPRPAAGVSVYYASGGFTVPAGKFIGALNYRYADQDEWYEHTSSLSGDDSKKVGHLNCIKFRYGIAEDWDVRTATPYVHTEVDLENRDDFTVEGIGDTLIQLRHRFVSQRDGAPVDVSWDLGFQAPTGETGDRDPGTGAWGGLIGGGVTYLSGRHRLEADMSYVMFTEGDDDLTKGDRTRVNGHYAYAVTNRLDLGLECNFEWTQEDDIDGTDQGNDQKALYIGPKFNTKWKEYGLIFGGAVLGAAYRECERESLTEEWRVEAKLIKSF
ncbi:transporter [Desulfovermiculus halophilus]|jgi:hypothetical protein|uniref:transporter n=1 Tax=Desulfovermiculus halophilus TaxID=339722 RepID=UPI00047F7165|nr:transporter [Desulfovermiculus halophilus]